MTSVEYPDTSSQPETVEFQGVTYRLMGGKRRYYLSQSTSNAGRRGAKGLHVAVWEHANGCTVPDGHHIHHDDEDPFNNAPENLVALTPSEHARRHADRHRTPEHLAHLERIRDRASEWHRSPEGRAWHAENARKNNWKHVEASTLTCQFCGSPFESKRRDAKYCGDRCGQRYRARERGHWPGRGKRK